MHSHVRIPNYLREAAVMNVMLSKFVIYSATVKLVRMKISHLGRDELNAYANLGFLNQNKH